MNKELIQALEELSEKLKESQIIADTALLKVSEILSHTSDESTKYNHLFQYEYTHEAHPVRQSWIKELIKRMEI